MKITQLLALLIGVSCLPIQAQVSDYYQKYLGRNPNWYDAANWSQGRVPAAGDDVLIDGDSRVVIDPALGPADVTIRDLRVRGSATLETLPGVFLHLRDELIEDRARVLFRSSADEGENLIVGTSSNSTAGDAGACGPANPVGCALEPLGPGGAGIFFNPTSQSKRTYVLKSSFPAVYGLGGTEPAAIQKTGAGTLVLNGAGYYATTTAEVVVLDDDLGISARIDRVPRARIDRLPLRLSLHYGFRPRAGDRFQIITAQRHLVGQFGGLPEGALVGCTDDNVGFYISYVGGDGNDVVLTAKDTRPAACLLLPAVQKVREAS